jgi:hypothetical protein
VLVRGTTAAAGGSHRQTGTRRPEVPLAVTVAAGGRHRQTGRPEVPPAVAVAAGGRHRLGGPRRRSARSPILVLARGLVPVPRPGGRHRKVTVARPRSRAARPAIALPLTLATVVAGGWVAGSAEPTLAAFTDPVTISGMTETAYTVPAPDGNSCALLTPGSVTTRGVNLIWPTAAKTTTYTTVVTGITATSKNVVTVGSDKQLQVRYNPSVVANQSKIATVTATPALTSTPSWTGPVTTWKFRTGATSSTQPVCGDATPAVVDIHAPDGVTRTPTAERAFITGAAGCTTDIGLCGTIQDASTISSVTYVLRRTQASVVRCFSGTAWVVACTPVTALTTTFNGVLTFYEDATTATVYPNTGTGTYTLTVTVTDSWANVTTTAVSFTLN